MDDRKASSETRGNDASVRLTFAEMERFRTKIEHRRKPCQKVKSSVLDFREVRDDEDGELAMRAGELRHCRE
jgi:hypothetical protein